MDGTSLYKRLIGYLRPYKFLFIGQFLAFFLHSLLSGPATAELLKIIIDNIQNPKENTAIFISLLILGVFGLRVFFNFIATYLLNYITLDISHNLRIKLFNKLLYLPMSYFDQNNIGHIVSKISYHINTMTQAISETFETLFKQGFITLCLIIYLIYLNWRLFLIFLILFPLTVITVYITNKIFRKISGNIQKAIGDITKVTAESVVCNRVIKIFNGYQYEKKRFNKCSKINKSQELKVILINSLNNSIIQLIFAICLSISVVVFIKLSLNLTTGEFVAFFTAAGMLGDPIRRLLKVQSKVQKGLAAAKEIFELLDHSAEPDCGKLPLKVAKGNITFNNVSFTYNNNLSNVIDNISFNIQEKKTIALVGKSGGGKSTVAKLIMRFYYPQKGTITLGGTDINNYKLDDFRQQISFVSQEVNLFNDTIENNISYCNKSLSKNQINQAIKHAHLESFINSLPDGVQTIVGDNGILLSGGQKQRIAIARSILKQAPIVILDEATSALDKESEHYIQQYFENINHKCTLIVIAHRLSTIKAADHILIVESGQLIEQGSHEELINKKGRYAKLSSI